MKNKKSSKGISKSRNGNYLENPKCRNGSQNSHAPSANNDSDIVDFNVSGTIPTKGVKEINSLGGKSTKC